MPEITYTHLVIACCILAAFSVLVTTLAVISHGNEKHLQYEGELLRDIVAKFRQDMTILENTAWTSFVDFLTAIASDVAEEMDVVLEVQVDGDGKARLKLGGFTFATYVHLRESWEAGFFNHQQTVRNEELRNRADNIDLLRAWEHDQEIEEWIRMQVSQLTSATTDAKH